MSVIIKDMKMPPACWCCPITKCEHCQHFYAESRPSNCPLVEVPAHSRLIDANELSFSDFELAQITLDSDNPYEDLAKALLKKIDNASTILEVEE